MSCREYQNQIVLSLYEELQDGERVSLELHLEECGECRQVFEESQGFHTILADDTSAKPPARVYSRTLLLGQATRHSPRS